MEKPWSQVELIREAFHYQSRFDGSTMVFKIDFPVIEHPLFPTLVTDLALLSQTGFRVVIVPGAKEWIDTILGEYGISTLYKSSIRLTSGAAMPFVQMAAFHSATRFMTGFSGIRTKGSRVEALIGNFVRARGLGVIDGVDMEHTGTVDKIYLESLNRVLELGMVPILPCIGWNSSGKPYNVPSDEIALETAMNLKAVKLFFISLSGGIKRDLYNIPEGIETGENGRVIRLTPQEAARVLEMNSGGDKALAELELAVKASSNGIERVHIIDGSEEGAILRELFSNLGTGTMVYVDEYESIRGIRSRDIPDILRLLEPLMRQGTLLWRKHEDIQGKKEDYAVFEIDGQIHACGALHDWGEEQGEIAAIATDPDYADMGLGSRIVKFLIDKAKKQKYRRIFVLTVRTQDWFESLGFRETSMETLPDKKRRLYDQNRNSKVFALNL
ncbi:MAG: amino-acid N-acetyltransferase [Treponema sp.]|jgi:amino-acid N-acetyltransferase|nr:amino-acid N-acetyltransferase [Treponema sp.]